LAGHARRADPPVSRGAEATPALRPLLHVTGSSYRLDVLTLTRAGVRVQT
jgi:hypothetical protein